MPNKRYLSGVRAERKLKAVLEGQKFLVIRASGSHGEFDLVAIPKYGGMVKLIQVKSVKGQKTAKAINVIMDKFLTTLPLPDSLHYTQEIWVWANHKWQWNIHVDNAVYSY